MRNLIVLILVLAAVLSVQAARVDTLTVDTKLMPTPIDITVITPDRAAGGESCNVVYLLNGYEGNHKQWLKTQSHLPQLSDKYGMIFVLPDGRDSWYWDAPLDKSINMESFIITELVPYIDKYYPTNADRDHRAITGLSMGGHGALYLAMRHPDIFGSAGSMSGAVDLTNYAGRFKMNLLLGDKAKYPKRYSEYSVMGQIANLKPGDVNIIFDCGIGDTFAKNNQDLHEALVAKGIPHDYTSRPGKHTHAYWANSILYHLLYFNEIFNKQ